MSGEEPLEAVTVTREDGTTYTVKLPPRLARNFKRQLRNLRGLILEVQTHAPEAGLYWHDGGPALMVGPTHTSGYPSRALHENVWVSGPHIHRCGGGDW